MSETLDMIKNTIKVLKQEIDILEKQVDNYEKELEKNSTQTKKEEKPIFSVSLENEFVEYMDRIGLSYRTIQNYTFALRKIPEDMNEILNTNFKYPLYYINDTKELQKVIDMFEDSTDLREINYHRHNLFSAAYNNYYNFLEKRNK